MEERQPIGVISIGSNDIHLLVATSDGITTFERQVNQSMLAELVGAVQGGVVPIKALYHCAGYLGHPFRKSAYYVRLNKLPCRSMRDASTINEVHSTYAL